MSRTAASRIVGVLAVLAVGTGVTVATAGTAVALPALTGTVTCSTFAGKGTFHPKLLVTGAAPQLKIKFAGTLTNCSGTPYVGSTGVASNVTGGHVKGVGKFTKLPAPATNVNRCSNFQGATPVDSVAVIKMVVHWTMSPSLAVAPSTVVYGGTYSAALLPSGGPPFTTMDLDLGQAAATTTTVTGSYAGSAAQNTAMHINVASAGCPVGVPFAFPGGTMTF